jgi:putative transcriptional regulator
MPVKNRLKQLLLQKMQQEETIITATTLADKTGLSRQMIHRWMNNEVTHFPGETIEKLCEYFNCEVGDLLVMVKKEDADKAPQQEVQP